MSEVIISDNPRRAIFNELAPQWDSFSRLKEGQASTLRGILESLALGKAPSVLDVGCGTGVLVPFLLPYLGENGRYTGLDVSDGMIAVARGKYSDPRLHFVAGDLYGCRAEGEGYDTVIVFSAFPHLHDKPAALEVLSRLTKRGGKLCVAHVESSRGINAYHSERVTNPVLKGDYLPSLDEMRAMTDMSLWKPIEGADREGLYLFILERR